MGSLIPILLRCVVALLLPAATLLVASPESATAKPRPNVVMITTDDQTLDSYNAGVMPKTQRLLEADGTTFTDAIVSTPQCCPSRATTITGQYAQNNGVEANRPGYPTLTSKGNVLPVWMQRAGYRTIHVGKFLNGYLLSRGLTPAPGWDRWMTLTRTHYSEPGFSINGDMIDFDGHLTDILTDLSVAAIERNMPAKKPVFLQVDHFAPHVGGGDTTGDCENAAVPAPGDLDAYADEPLPDSPSFDESDLSDKLNFLQTLEPFSDEDVDEITRRYRCALGSLTSVDEGIAETIEAIRASGELRNTMIIFTSDNGYAYGEHRMMTGKGLPYEEHIRVPLVIRPPLGKRFGRADREPIVSDATVGNVDLAPTILDVAGARPCRQQGRGCRRLDGHSLVGLLRGQRPEWASSRRMRIGFFINADAYRLSCRWVGYRSSTEVVVRHTELPYPRSNRCTPSTAVERFDRKEDPFQLDGESRELDADVIRRVMRIARCSGIAGRDKRIRGVPYCQ